MGLSYTGRSCLLMLSLTGCNRVPAPPASTMPFKPILERPNGGHGDRYVVDDRGNGCPERQRRQALRIERYDDRIARLHLRIRCLEPAMAVGRHDAAVRMHDVDLAAIR